MSASQRSAKRPDKTARRLLHMLTILPQRREDAISTPELHEKLLKAKFKLSKRTLERNLSNLTQLDEFSYLHSYVDGRTNRWWLSKKVPQLALPPNTALTLSMLIDHARPFCAPALLDDLEPLYRHAKGIVESHSSDWGSDRDWSKKIVSHTRFVQLQPAAVDPDVLGNIQSALRTNCAVKALYHSRNKGTDHEIEINPLGMSFQDGNLYLACTYRGESLVRALPLHRFKRVDPPGWAFAEIPANFDMREEVKKHSFVTLMSDVPIRLELRVNKAMFERLSENPLHPQQSLTPDDQGSGVLRCDILHSQGLELWLLAQGDSVEVLAPTALRREMGAKTRRMASLYAE